MFKVNKHGLVIKLIEKVVVFSEPVCRRCGVLGCIDYSICGGSSYYLLKDEKNANEFYTELLYSPDYFEILAIIKRFCLWKD